MQHAGDHLQYLHIEVAHGQVIVELSQVENWWETPSFFGVPNKLERKPWERGGAGSMAYSLIKEGISLLMIWTVIVGS